MILKIICSLRNSGGDVLEIRMKPELGMESCINIVNDAVNEMLSNTDQNDLSVSGDKKTSSIFVKSCEEIVTMNYNLCIMKDGEAELVPPTKSAADVRSLLLGTTTSEVSISSAPSTSMSQNYKIAIANYKIFFKDHEIPIELRGENVNFRKLEGKFPGHSDRAAFCVTLENNKLREYVSAFANDRGGVFIKDPESYFFSSSMPFSMWIECLKNPKKMVLAKKSTIDIQGGLETSFPVGGPVLQDDSFELRHLLDEKSEIKQEYKKKLEGLEWVESFHIVNSDGECSECHLQIVCWLDKVPCTRDIIKIFGKKIFPCITYKKGSKSEWFKTNVFGRNSGREKTKLDSLSWVERYHIVTASKPEKSLQI